MPRPSLSFVADACVLIDLHRGRILSRCLRSRVTLETTDFVVDLELIDPPGEEIVNQGLGKRIIPGDRTALMTELLENPELSAPDASVAVLALMHNSILLTKDGPLKVVSSSLGITTRSTLWLMDQMVEMGYLTAELAQRALNSMEYAGRILNSAEKGHYRRKW